MRTFTANLNTEKNKKTGAKPVWILKIPFASGTVYLTDRSFTYDGVITVKPWIKSWGQIDENISDELGSPQVSDFSCDIIIDPNEATDIHDLLWSEKVETIDCELYLWFEGLNTATDPMVQIWSGNIVDFERTSELVYSVRLVDESVRIDKYPGRVLSLADYGNASLNDVGYQLPIIYGSVTKSKAIRLDVGKKTTLNAAIDNDDIDFYLESGTGLSDGSHILIEAEEIEITTIVGNHITACNRGHNSTTAAAHALGTMVREKKATCVYMFADHPVHSIGNVYIKKSDGTMVDITTLATKYTGQGGANDLAGYAGKAVITVAGYISFELATTLGLTESISYSATYDGTSTEEIFGTGLPGSSTNSNDIISVGFTTMSTANVIQRYWEVGWHINVFSLVSGGGDNVHQCIVNMDGATVALYTMTTATVSHDAAAVLNHVVTNWTTWSVPAVGGYSGGSWIVTIDYAKQIQRRQGNAGTIGFTNGEVILNDELYISGEGYQDDGAGTFSGVADELIEQPDHIMKHFLYTYSSWPVADFSTDAAAYFAADSYKFSVSMASRKRIKEWCAYMALQCRCWFRFAAGKAYLLYRPDSLSTDKTITTKMIRMTGDYSSTVKLSRSPLDEIINSVKVYYSRDWSRAAGREAYQAITSTASATSITAYGEKEKPDSFLFDFVADGTMAADLASFYLSRYKDRKKVVRMDLFLDNAELEFGDHITINSASVSGEVRKVNFAPGGADQNDIISIEAREY